jgi:purine-binding chemotaxis protein CheW
MKNNFIIVKIAEHDFAINAEVLREILFAKDYKIYPVPLVCEEMLGCMDLHGGIVSVLDSGQMLGLKKLELLDTSKFIIVEYEGELFALLVDEVEEAIHSPAEDFTNNFTKVDKAWKDISHGIFLLKDKLVVVLDLNKLISILFKK